MTFVIADRVKETTTTTGTGSLALGGAATGYRAFSAVCANNDIVAYAVSSSGGSEWETGFGTWQTGNTLVRTAVLASSNANAAVSFSAGPKDVYLTVIAAEVGTGNKLCDGRLTLTSGTPVTAGDTTNTSIFYSPYGGNQIALYTNSAWRTYRFSELTFAIGTVTSGAIYDLFVWDNAGTLTLARGPAWSSAAAGTSSRGTGAGTTELELVDGVKVNKIALSGGPAARQGRYVGSFMATSTTQTQDNTGGNTTQVGGKRFLYNEYNKVLREMVVLDTTDSWSYTTDTVRQANGAAGNKVEWIDGSGDSMVKCVVHGTVYVKGNAVRAAKVGVGVNGTTVFFGLVAGAYNEDITYAGYFALTSEASVNVLGYNFAAWCEKGADTTCIFLGDNGGDSQVCGLVAYLMM